MGIARSRVELNLHTPCIFLSASKIYTIIMKCYKFCSFLRSFSKSCCTLLFVHTVLESSVYFNSQNIIHFYALLVKINLFCFACVECSIFDLILFTPPLVQRVGSFLCVFSTNCFIFSYFQFSKLPCADIKIALMFLAFDIPSLSLDHVSTR